MADVIAEWAGKERLFRLMFGGVLDLEQACGGDAVGAIFIRVSSGQFRAADLYHTIRLALIGGGEGKLEAKRLMDAHFDTRPYMENAALAGDILIALMTGVEDTEAKGDKAPEPFRFSEVSQLCRVFNMSPADLRAMTYADFLNMMKGFNAGSKKQAEAPTEAEFFAMLKRSEERKGR